MSSGVSQYRSQVWKWARESERVAKKNKRYESKIRANERGRVLKLVHDHLIELDMTSADSKRHGYFRRMLLIAGVVESEKGWWLTADELLRLYIESTGDKIVGRTMRRCLHVMVDVGMVEVKTKDRDKVRIYRWVGWPDPIYGR